MLLNVWGNYSIRNVSIISYAGICTIAIAWKTKVRANKGKEQNAISLVIAIAM